MTMTDTSLDGITFLSEDDVEHLLCAECYPEYIPGRMVITVCGIEDDDETWNSDFVRSDVTCDTCRATNFCPKCGADLWWWM